MPRLVFARTLDNHRFGPAHGAEEGELVHEDVRRLAERFDRTDRAVRPDFEDEAVVVGRLADARLFDAVVDLADGREDGVDGNDPDGHAFDGAGGDVALADLDVELDVEAGGLAVEGGDVQFGVDDFEVGGHLDVGGGDFAGAFGIEGKGAGTVGEGLEADLLDGEEKLGGVLLRCP